ncbi:MAG TPA: dipeptidase [Pyrinomonadaceae bacterium]|nr:dipeptidase [Pyrinomonadaceae bacterium]
MRKCVAVFILLWQAFSAMGQTLDDPLSHRNYTVTEKAAAAIVRRVLKRSPIIDGHNDLFIHFVGCKTCPRDVADYPIDKTAAGHTDIPRWRKGGVGGQLLTVSGGDDKPENLMRAYDLAFRLEYAYPKDLKIVGSAKEMRSAMKMGKIALLPILEGAVVLNDDPALLRTFYRLGLRSVTLAYKTNGLADGSDDPPKHNGVSASGKEIIREMNRLGVLIDISHVSEKAMTDALETTQAPLIFSHSNARALADLNRNVSDATLLKLKTNRGIIMLTFVPYFTTAEHFRWLDAGDRFYDQLQKLHNGEAKKVKPAMEKWGKENPQPLVTIADIADHFDHVKILIGADHIGMAGDYDGIAFTIKGLGDVSTYPFLLMELARRGWTERELKKVTGENFLRVFEAVERKARLLQQTTPPLTLRSTVETR